MKRRWPAEWERHKATWLTWPSNADTWPGCLPAVERCFVQLIRILAERETVHLLVSDALARQRACQLIGPCRNVALHDIATNDAWIRDYGPTFVTLETEQGAVELAVNWHYNGWGEKYPPFTADRAAGSRVAETAERCFRPAIVLEGGAIEGNGAGTLLTTASCIFNDNRNPGLGSELATQQLGESLGVSQVVFLPGCDLTGDDTDGHVDQLARFVSRDVVVTASCDNVAHADFNSLRDHVVAVREMVAPCEVVELPVPHVRFKNQTLPASYCNFYFANDSVIVPVYGEPEDEVAMGIIRDLLPKRELLALDARDLLVGCGSIHCVTQQQPWIDSPAAQPRHQETPSQPD